MSKTPLATATVRDDGHLHFTHDAWAAIGIADPRGHHLVAMLVGVEVPLRIVQCAETRQGVGVRVTGPGWKAVVPAGGAEAEIEIVSVRRPVAAASAGTFR
jgi:hypothetical protein